MQRLILEFAVRAALIAFGTAAVLRVLRVKSAGALHGAWAGVLVLMLLLPAWTAWGPHASMRVLPAPPAAAATSTIVLSTPAIFIADGPIAPVSQPPVRTWNWPATLLAVYLFGTIALLARLAVGMIRAHLLVRRARLCEGHWTSPSCAAPVTVGLLRPSVILPECWRTWPQSQLDAVLAHEGEHVRRRDPLVQWLALLNRAIFWFHPLAWWLERRLSVLAEEACDAAVLSRGCDPYDYSTYLLDIARTIERTGGRVNMLGMAMPGSSLPQRIRQILARGPVPRMSRARTLCVAAACILVSAMFAAATVDRQQSPPEPPAPPAAPAPPSPSFDGPPAPPPAPPDVPPAPPARSADAIPVPPVPPPPPAVPSADAAPAPPPPPPAVRSADAAAAPPPPPQPQEARARQETRYSNNRLIALFFDLAGMTPEDETRATSAANKFINSQLTAQDLVSVIAFGDSGVRVIQDFTDDRTQLLSAIAKLPQNVSNYSSDTRLAALQTATKMLGVLPNKKSMVYFTNGMSQYQQGDLNAVVNAAVRANVAFYPIDARGLVTNVAVGSQFRLSPDDVVQVTGWDSHLIDGRYTVRADGVLAIPQLGEIKATGLTTEQLEAVINDRLAASGIVKEPRTAVMVVTAHSVK